VSDLQQSYSHCEALLRDRDIDAWLAGLFAPERSRRHLHALYAFSNEIARIAYIVSEPALGEIRLQWWAEAIAGERAQESAANPVCAAVLDTMRIARLPVEPLLALIEARRFDLYHDPMPSLADLEGYCGETVSALFRLAALALCEGEEAGGADACGHAGVAFGLTSILADLPRHAARGRCFLPSDLLARHGALPEAAAAGVVSEPLLAALAELRACARDHLTAACGHGDALDIRARPALALLALVEPCLRRMERRGYDPFASDVRPPQWRRQWALWRWSL